MERIREWKRGKEEERRGELLELEQLMRFLFIRQEDVILWMKQASEASA